MRPRLPNYDAWLALIFMVALSFYTLTAHAFSVEKVVTLVGPTSVSVLGPTGGEGSGVSIGDGYIVTAAHVIDDFKKFKVVSWGGKVFDAVRIGSNKGTDVGLLRIEGVLKVIKFRIKAARYGERVVLLGSPYGHRRTLSVGYVANPNETMSAKHARALVKDVIQLDINAQPGDSGGLIVDSRGRLLGIMSYDYGIRVSPFMQRGIPQGMGFAIKTRDILTSVIRIKDLYDYPGYRQW